MGVAFGYTPARLGESEVLRPCLAVIVGFEGRVAPAVSMMVDTGSDAWRGRVAHRCTCATVERSGLSGASLHPERACGCPTAAIVPLTSFRQPCVDPFLEPPVSHL